MPEKQNLDSIFLAAVEIESEQQQAAFLDEACGADEACRAQVEKLLAAHEQAGSFMREPDGTPVTVDHQSAHVDEGTEIDNYKRLQRIGEGGFGAVYMAEQLRPVRRKVALKITDLLVSFDTPVIIEKKYPDSAGGCISADDDIAHAVPVEVTKASRPRPEPFTVVQCILEVTLFVADLLVR